MASVGEVTHFEVLGYLYDAVGLITCRLLRCCLAVVFSEVFYLPGKCGSAALHTLPIYVQGLRHAFVLLLLAALN